METTPADAVKAAVEQALAMTDPTERGRIITEIIAAVEKDTRLTEAREADVRALYETRTLGEVGELVKLSVPRVHQIVTGSTTGRRAARKRATAQTESDAS
jgi:hypothetical protein